MAAGDLTIRRVHRGRAVALRGRRCDSFGVDVVVALNVVSSLEVPDRIVCDAAGRFGVDQPSAFDRCPYRLLCIAARTAVPAYCSIRLRFSTCFIASERLDLFAGPHAVAWVCFRELACIPLPQGGFHP